MPNYNQQQRDNANSEQETDMINKAISFGYSCGSTQVHY